MNRLRTLIFMMTPAASGVDSDAQSFITTAGITDATQKSAIDTLVKGLKADSIWSKMTVIYPYVGGDATKHSYNLKNPAANQITWSGTITHDANGVTGNGSTGKGDTGLNLSSGLSLNDVHMSCYSRTVSTSTGAEMGGTGAGTTAYAGLFCKYTDNNLYGELWATGTANDEASGAVTNSQGLFTVSRTAINAFAIYRNSTSIATKTGNRTGTQPNINLFLLCQNNNGSGGANFSARNLAWQSAGAGLTSTDVTNLQARVQTFQTTLSRQV